MKEIHICKDGIIIVYRYKEKTRYITHHFDGLHNGKMGKSFIDNKISVTDKMWKLKWEKRK